MQVKTGLLLSTSSPATYLSPRSANPKVSSSASSFTRSVPSSSSQLNATSALTTSPNKSSSRHCNPEPAGFRHSMCTLAVTTSSWDPTTSVSSGMISSYPPSPTEPCDTMRRPSEPSSTTKAVCHCSCLPPMMEQSRCSTERCSRI